jgi:hypothetical protein
MMFIGNFGSSFIVFKVAVQVFDAKVSSRKEDIGFYLMSFTARGLPYEQVGRSPVNWDYFV